MARWYALLPALALGFILAVPPAHGGQCAGKLADRADVVSNPAGMDYDVYFFDDDITDADYAPQARAQWVRDALADSHDVYVSAAYGFRRPYFSKSPNDTCIYDMSAGILGSAPKDHINIDAPHVETDAQQRIIETTLHELFHHVQYAYIDYNDWPSWGKWTIEGTAAMMEDKVFAASDNDGGTPYVGRVNSLLNNPNVTLTDRAYNAALFWTYLTEQLGLSVMEPGRGVDVVRRFWQNTDGHSPDSVKYLKETIRNFDSTASFESMFRDFSIANYTHDLDTSLLSDPDRYRYVDESGAGGGTAYNAVSRTTVPSFNTTYSSDVNRWGAKYFQIDIPSEKRCEAIGFWGQAEAGKNLSWALVGISGGQVREVLTGKGRTFYRALVNPPRGLYDRLAAVVVGLDRGAQFDYAFGWGAISGQIRRPDLAHMAYVGAIGDPPERFQVRLVMTGPGVLTPSGSGTVSIKGLDASDFQASLRSDATGRVYAATILSATYVSGEYWLTVQAPEVDPADGQLYDLEVCFCEDRGSCQSTLTSVKSVLYTDVTRNQMLVLDRSYSMHYPTADPKLEAAKNACRVYVNVAGEDDRMGFVTFSGNDSECDFDVDNRQYKVGLADVTTAQRNTLLNTINRVRDDSPWKGWTSIGDGLIEGRNEVLTASGVADVLSLVLLSDGLENEGDFWASPNSACGTAAVRDSFGPGGAAQDIRVDTLAFGPDADETLLQNIAAFTGGDPYAVSVDSAAGSSPATSVSKSASRASAPDPAALEVPNRLAQAYLSISEDVHEKNRLFFASLNLTAGKSASMSIPVTEKSGGGVAQAVFAFNWNVPTRRMEIVLRDADDTVVDAENPNWRIYQDQKTNKTYHYQGVLPPGTYQVTLQADQDLQVMGLLAGRLVRGVDIDLNFSQVPLYEKCDYQRLARFLRGRPVTILVNLNDSRGGIPGLDLVASIRFGVNSRCVGVKNPTNRLILYDDGGHEDGLAGDGIYGNVYFRTPCYSAGEEDAAPDFPGWPFKGQSGAYQVTVTARGKSNYGDPFVRYITRSFQVYEYVNQECRPDQDKDGLPDRWEDLHGLDKTDPADAALDPDNDRLTNLEEFYNGTLPFNPDTDRGGEADGSEVAAGRDPLYTRDDAMSAILDYGIIAKAHDIPGYDPEPNTNLLRFQVSDGYKIMRIYRRDPMAAAFTEVAALNLAAVTPRGVYRDKGLLNGNTYFYYLQAEGESGALTPPTEIFKGTPQPAGHCATFDVGTLILHIPCLDMGGSTAYWLDLKLTPTGLVYSNHGLAETEIDTECVTFNFLTMTLHIPCLDLGGPKTYWLDMVLTLTGFVPTAWGLNP